MMRSKLKGTGLPKNLWAEAIIAACYIKNRFTSLNKSTPHELWFGTKPVPREMRKALDDRSEQYIFIEYGSGNIYRLLTKKTRKLVIARDVKFDESLLGFGHFRNKVEPLYINDDDKEENKLLLKTLRNNVSSIESNGKEGLRRSRRLKAKENVKKEEEEKKDSKEDDSILTDIETYSDSESFQDSVKPRQTLLSLLQVWFSKRWSMESLMRLNLLLFKMPSQDRN